MNNTAAGVPAGYVARVRRLVASSPKRERLFFSGYVNRTAGAAIAVLLQPTSITPNVVSVAGLVVHALAAGVLVLSGSPISPWAWLAVLLLWQLAFNLDSADGQLARLRGQGSAFGAWLDMCIDVITHVMVYGALAIFLVRALALDGLTAAMLTSVAMGSHLLQLVTGWKHDIVGSDPALPNPPRWLALSMHARHLIDYGWFLFAAGALLRWPPLLLVFFLASCVLHLLAAVIQLSLNWYRYLGDSRLAAAGPPVPR